MQGSLFGTSPTAEVIHLDGGHLRYWPGVMASPDAFTRWHQHIPWQTGQVCIAGELRTIPRLQAWFGDAGSVYTYSGVTLTPLPWSAPLRSLKTTLEDLTGTRFNSLLANLYRNGQDCMGWHADDEPELGRDPVIVSCTFGSPRRFRLRLKADHRTSHELALGDGDVLAMEGNLQHLWEHGIPREPGAGARINFTFRALIPRTGTSNGQAARMSGNPVLR